MTITLKKISGFMSQYDLPTDEGVTVENMIAQLLKLLDEAQRA